MARVHGNEIANRQIIALLANPLADRLDLARPLMPQHKGLHHREVAHPRVMEIVEVGAADPAGPDADPHLARAWVRNVPPLDPKILDPVEDGGPAHDASAHFFSNAQTSWKPMVREKVMKSSS